MLSRPRLLSLGDRVRYDGREHTVVALHGTSVRLVDDAQAASVVLLGHLLASEGFSVLTPNRFARRCRRKAYWRACPRRPWSGSSGGAGT